MLRKKTSNKERGNVTKKQITLDEVYDNIYSIPIVQGWRQGQFVFNRASALYGDAFVRSLGHDPFYNDKNIEPFVEALTEALNKLN